MKKFIATVTKTWEYEIDIDETVWTDEYIENWASVFSPVNSLDDVVECLAIMKTDYNNGESMEGFCIPYINGKAPYVSDREKDFLSPDININIIQDGDHGIDVDVKEIE